MVIIENKESEAKEIDLNMRVVRYSHRGQKDLWIAAVEMSEEFPVNVEDYPVFFREVSVFRRWPSCTTGILDCKIYATMEKRCSPEPNFHNDQALPFQG